MIKSSLKWTKDYRIQTLKNFVKVSAIAKIATLFCSSTFQLQLNPTHNIKSTLMLQKG